jgi:AraC family transcriptional regulator
MTTGINTVAASQDTFGGLLAHQYGLDEVQSSTTSSARSPLEMASMHYDLPHLFVLEPLPPEDAFVLSVELTRAGSRRFFKDSACTCLERMEPGAIHIADLAEQPFAYVCSPFHSVLFHMSRAAIDEFAQEAGAPPVAALSCEPGTVDPVVVGLATAVLPSLLQPQEADSLFLDHVALALYAHAARAYGGMRAPPATRRGGLAPWQERRAKELLTEQLRCDVSLADVASACHLSRGHFSKSFKETTGQSPHAWRVGQRIDTAQRMLLESTASLAEIAQACGFADQSHLTRVFGERVGTSPAHWRRLRRN